MSALVPPAGEYALRACACLAAAPGRALTARELAVQAHVPAAFLSKVLRRLVANGLLDAHKGHHGGFRLALPPSQVRLADVLRAAEVELNPPHCAFGFARCDARAPCPLHDVYTRLQGLCQMWAQATTLDQLDLHRLVAGGDLSLEAMLEAAEAAEAAEVGSSAGPGDGSSAGSGDGASAGSGDGASAGSGDGASAGSGLLAAEADGAASARA